MPERGTRKVTVQIESVVENGPSATFGLGETYVESVIAFKMPDGWSVSRVEKLLTENGFTREERI